MLGVGTVLLEALLPPEDLGRNREGCTMNRMLHSFAGKPLMVQESEAIAWLWMIHDK